MTDTLNATGTRQDKTIAETDIQIAQVIRDEIDRQNTGLELIASENFVSGAVLETMGSVLTNK